MIASPHMNQKKMKRSNTGSLSAPRPARIAPYTPITNVGRKSIQMKTSVLTLGRPSRAFPYMKPCARTTPSGSRVADGPTGAPHSGQKASSRPTGARHETQMIVSSSFVDLDLRFT